MESAGRIKAYFTVEAALVMPVVLGVVVFLIYMMLFQYDRCLMEQDVGVLALRGITAREQDKAVLAGVLQEYARYKENAYIAWDVGEICLELEGNRVKVSRTGQLVFPSKNIWKTEITYENEQINPVFLIRSCKKLMGGN